MADEGRVQRFADALQRLDSANPLREKDAQIISQLNVVQPNRVEHETPSEKDRPTNLNEFLKAHNAPRYHGMQEALHASGWVEMPDARSHLGTGGYGRVILTYLRDDPRDIESKQLCAAKIQKLWNRAHPDSKFQSVWREISCLRACVHPNIIGYYGLFYVLPQNPTGSTDRSRSEAVILMEYANAGNLPKELERAYGCLPEACARYYMLQITAGLKYLHNRWIAHMDLHEFNILLKYNNDFSKTCMIADFGVSAFLPPEKRTTPQTFTDKFFTRDIIQAIDLLHVMLVGMDNKHADPSYNMCTERALDVIDARDNCQLKSVDELLKFSWFSYGDAEPFMSCKKKRTPLFERRSAVPPELRVSPSKSSTPTNPRASPSLPKSAMPQQFIETAARSAVEDDLENVRASRQGNLRSRIGRSFSRMRIAVGERLNRINCFGRRDGVSGRDSGIGKSTEQTTRSRSPSAGPHKETKL